MRVYRYVAIDKEARRVRGTLEAEDNATLIQLLAEQGLYCESYTYRDKSARLRVTYKMKAGDLVIFCNQMGIMLKAGVQLPAAMNILCDRTDRPEQRELYERLSEQLHTGGMLSEAMADQGRAFPPMMIQMMSAAEASGTMDETMDALSEYFEREKARNAKIRSATTYPIVLFVLMIGMLAAIFGFVMPRLLPLMSAGDGMNKGMKVLVAITDFLGTKWYVLLLAILGVLLVYAILYAIPSVQERIDRLKLSMPILGKLRRTMYVSRFCQAFATLYRSGIRVSDALDMASATVVNSYFNRRCSEARAKVDTGTDLSRALGETGMFDSMFCSMIHVGEESGEMEEVLMKLAVYYDREGQAAISRAVDMIQPIFIIFLALIVGSIVITIMTSMYGMYGNVTQMYS